MPRLKREVGVVKSLIHRELLLTKSTYRTSLKTLKSIVCSEGKPFGLVWETQSKKPIVYTDGKLFLDNYKKCLTICGRHGLPSCIYEMDLRRVGKIEDTVTFSCPVYRSSLDSPVQYKSFLSCVTSSNWLRHYNIETGQDLESVYLGPPTRCKYRHIDWERHGETIVVMSVKNPLREVTQASSHVLVVIIWFSVLPLKFKAAFEFDKQVFGKECTHCNVSEGLLIVGTGSSTTGTVRLYNFYETVQNSLLFECDIGQSCDTLDGASLGSYPSGIPLNCKVKEPPPVLFQVQCSEYNLHFGCYPFHFVTSIPKYPEIFQVSDVINQKMVENGRINISSSDFEKCHISFHGDDSGRIIHYSHDTVRFFKLVEGDGGLRKLHESFKINLDSTETISSQPNQILQSHAINTRSRPERQSARKRITDYNYGYSTSDRALLCDDYENELDIYAVLFVTCKSLAVTIHLYDNITERKMKSVRTNILYDELSEYELILDLDSILIIEKNADGLFKCFMYQMHKGVKEKKKNNKTKKTLSTKRR